MYLPFRLVPQQHDIRFFSVGFIKKGWQFTFFISYIEKKTNFHIIGLRRASIAKKVRQTINYELINNAWVRRI